MWIVNTLLLNGDKSYYTLISVKFIDWPFDIPSNVEILGCHLDFQNAIWKML
jgi:hypothetical protein